MAETESDNLWFPIGRLIVGALIGGILVLGMFVQYDYLYGYSKLDIPNSLGVGLLLMFLAGLIPMIIVSEKDAVHKETISWIAFLSMFCPAGVLLFLVALIWAIFDQGKDSAEKARISQFKTEIVNNDNYLIDKKTERMSYLRRLKKETVSEIAKKNKELEDECNKIKSIPADVAKYIKQRDMTSINADISKLEYKLLAIDALIKSETVKKSTSVERAESELDYDDDDDDD